RSAAERLSERGHELLDRHAYLAHRVALADRHGAIVDRLEVDRHAERRADLVLTAVAPADRLRLVVRRHEMRPDLRPDVARDGAQALVLREREDGDLVRREVWTEAHHDARALLVGLLVVRGAH